MTRPVLVPFAPIPRTDTGAIARRCLAYAVDAVALAVCLFGAAGLFGVLLVFA
ncbi:MAG: hypothetical protein KKB37_11200 [Alphaproteobacteria bacterium]|nr:hypothetical protein [Alphaproteobacteria bacterium]